MRHSTLPSLPGTTTSKIPSRQFAVSPHCPLQKLGEGEGLEGLNLFLLFPWMMVVREQMGEEEVGEWRDEGVWEGKKEN